MRLPNSQEVKLGLKRFAEKRILAANDADERRSLRCFQSGFAGVD
jgi:hypothetical protein